jgi:hypothetical protein
VNVVGTKTRRHTIGLISSSHTLSRTIAATSVADGGVVSSGRGCFDRRFIGPAYRLCPGSPQILMLPQKLAHRF